MDVLHELHANGHTIILVTHDQQVASHAERVIEISDGVIVRDQPNLERQATRVTSLQDKEPAAHSSNVLQANWGRFAEAFTMALIAMASHRMRTLLTMLGIVIGITSVVSVVALGQGAQQKVVKDISSMGTNVIDVNPGKDWGDEDAASIQTLVPSDLEALQSQVYVDSASPATGGSQLLRYHNVTANASVNGVGEQFFRVKGYEIAGGMAFDRDDVKQQAQVAVIDQNTSKKFFAGEDPIGKIIFIGSLPCRVIGVTKPKDGPFGSSSNLEVWIPYSAAMNRLLGQQYFSSITVRVKDGVSNQIAEQSIIKLMTERHGRKDYYTNSSDSIMKTINKTTTTLAMMISAICGHLAGGRRHWCHEHHVGIRDRAHVRDRHPDGGRGASRRHHAAVPDRVCARLPHWRDDRHCPFLRRRHHLSDVCFQLLHGVFHDLHRVGFRLFLDNRCALRVPAGAERGKT